MYVSGWVTLVAVSLWVSVLAFVWALRTGQFSDQGRARYLPLRGEPLPIPSRHASKWTIEVYALAVVGCIALLGFLAAIFLSIHWVKP
jgi:nitrogen fixation-related uncharacterized protein